jgi:hypothetical protein
MNDARSTRIVVDLEDGDAPVCGRLQVAGHPSVPFTGWLELISALDRAHEPAHVARLEAVREEQR